MSLLSFWYLGLATWACRGITPSSVFTWSSALRVCPHFFLLMTPVIGLGPTLLHCDLIFIWLHLQRPLCNCSSNGFTTEFRGEEVRRLRHLHGPHSFSWPLVKNGWPKIWLQFFLKKQYLFNFRERGRKGEREGEKHHYVVATRVPCTEDLACNPGMCPGWEWNRRPFGSQASTQSTEQHQPGLNIFLKDFIYLFLKRWEGRENERERNIDWLPLVRHTTQAYALTRN